MTKGELIAAVTEKAGGTKAQTEKTLNALLDTITNTVAEGDKVSLVGFGVFEARDRAARTGTNPQTGESISIAASKVPAFKAGAAFKAAVNK